MNAFITSLYPLWAGQKRPGFEAARGERHLDALLAALDTLNWVLNHPLIVGGMKE